MATWAPSVQFISGLRQANAYRRYCRACAAILERSVRGQAAAGWPARISAADQAPGTVKAATCVLEHRMGRALGLAHRCINAGSFSADPPGLTAGDGFSGQTNKPSRTGAVELPTSVNRSTPSTHVPTPRPASTPRRENSPTAKPAPQAKLNLSRTARRRANCSGSESRAQGRRLTNPPASKVSREPRANPY